MTTRSDDEDEGEDDEELLEEEEDFNLKQLSIVINTAGGWVGGWATLVASSN